MEDERRQHEDRRPVLANIEGLESRDLKMEDGLGFSIHLRPGVIEYLKELSDVADVYAFTAGLPVYARPVIQHLDPEKRIFQKVWFRDSCSLNYAIGAYGKDLRTMKQLFDPNRTILVDNNIFSFVPQPMNGIHVPDFYNNPSDRELPRVLDIVKDLSACRDVRPVLHEMFDIPARINNKIKR